MLDFFPDSVPTMSIVESSKILMHLVTGIRFGVKKDLYFNPLKGMFIDESSMFLKLEAPGWKESADEELKKLRRIHPLIQAVVSSYIQLEIEDAAFKEWLRNLRQAFDETRVFYDELAALLNYVRHPTYVPSKRGDMKSSLALRRIYGLSIPKCTRKIIHLFDRMDEALFKLYNISAKVSTFRHLLEDAEQQQQQLDIVESPLPAYTTESEISRISQSDEGITDVLSDHAAMDPGNIHGLERETKIENGPHISQSDAVITYVPSDHTATESGNIQDLGGSTQIENGSHLPQSNAVTTDASSDHVAMKLAGNIQGRETGTEIDNGLHFSYSNEIIIVLDNTIHDSESGTEIVNGGSSVAKNNTLRRNLLEKKAKYCRRLYHAFQVVRNKVKYCCSVFLPGSTADIGEIAKYCSGFSIPALFVAITETTHKDNKSNRELMFYRVGAFLLFVSSFCSFLPYIISLQNNNRDMGTLVALRMSTQVCLIRTSVITLLASYVILALNILL